MCWERELQSVRLMLWWDRRTDIPDIYESAVCETPQNTETDLYTVHIYVRKWCHRWPRREVPRFVPLMIDIVLIMELWLHRLDLLCIVPDQSQRGRRQLSHKGTSFVVVLLIWPKSSADKKKTEKNSTYKIWTYTVVTRTQHPTLKTRFCLMAIKILCCIEKIYHTSFIRSPIQFILGVPFQECSIITWHMKT